MIGVDGKLPWYLREDLKFFKRMTQAKPLVMGRKTYVSIGKPLPNRLNIVVTRDTAFAAEGTRICHDLPSALALADQHATIEAAEEIMVMGGGEIYQQALPFAQRLYITEVDIDVEGEDVGLANAGTTVTSSTPKPPKTAGERVTDEGDGGVKVAEYLVGQKII